MTPSTQPAAWRRSVAVATLCSLCILVGVSWSASATTTARPAATSSAVAVIDLNRLIEGLTEYQEIVARLIAEGEAGQKSLADINARIRAVEAELETLKDRTSQAWLNKALERAELQEVGEARVKILRQKQELGKGEAMRAIYSKVTDAVARLGQQDGWDLIMLDDRDLLPRPREDRLVTASDMNQYVVTRRVLFVSPRVDITEHLITMMNNEFKAARR